MLNRVIAWSIRRRAVVIALWALAAISGVISAARLPLDAFPDTTPVQVQVNTVAPALGPEEIETRITIPVELAIAGLPRLELVRSISKFGLSQVTIVFEDGTDIYFARQLVLERVRSADLPEGTPRPELGPVATGLGEVFHYLVRPRDAAPGDVEALTRARTEQEWVLRTRLRRVAGAAEVNTWGGFERQAVVSVEPAKLVRYGLTLDEVATALERNGRNVGGGRVRQAGEQLLVRGIGRPSALDDIREMVVKAVRGVPVLVRDVADVSVGHEVRRGAVTADGRGEVVLGLGFMLMGESSRVVTERFREELREAAKALPGDLEVTPVYDRTALVSRVIATVERNLFEGALLVIAVLFVFLGRLRAGLLVALAIPLSMLCAASLMHRFGIAGSLMSLGAIDFGLIVDSSVIQVENAVRHLSEPRRGRSVEEVVEASAVEVRQPTLMGELIIAIVYLPILTLEGIEGKLFRPMALTVVFALAGSMLLSLTLVPALTSLFLRGERHRREPWVVRAAQSLYAPVLGLALRRRGPVLAGAVAALTAAALAAPRLGAEFVPRLSEGAIVINTVRLAGVSLEETVRCGTMIERAILAAFPDEVERVWTRSGTAEVATDPMGVELSDIFVTLAPRERWRRAHDQASLAEAIRDDLADFPGMRAVFTQPIEMRVNEMVAGIRADLGVKVFGDDYEVLKAGAAQVEAILKSVTGSADVYTEQVTGLPVLEVEVDRAAVARLGIPAGEVLEAVEALGGRRAGEVFEGDRRFPIVLRLPEAFRGDPSAIGRLLVTTAKGQRVPLARLAKVRVVEGPAQVNREWAKRRVVVSANVRDRDVGSFVSEARRRVESEVRLPPGAWLEWGGQFEHLERASRRLAIVVPLALFMIFGLLYATYGTLTDSLRVFTGVPFAAVGGILALHLRGLPFSVSAGVGFVALSGVSVLGDMVLVSQIRRLLAGGLPLDDAIRAAAQERLRPVLMTALVAALGFVPMALSTGVGSEVQRPLATVVIGGVASSTLLTLVVLPVLYSLVGGRGGVERPAPGYTRTVEE
jgi:cobalt-zinc-cadmium resistance protein CzcA